MRLIVILCMPLGLLVSCRQPGTGATSQPAPTQSAVFVIDITNIERGDEMLVWVRTSIRNMAVTQKFNVMIIRPNEPRRLWAGLKAADSAATTQAEIFLNELFSGGQIDYERALQAALDNDADVVYLITDWLPDNQDQIARWNALLAKSKRPRLCVVWFGGQVPPIVKLLDRTTVLVPQPSEK